MPADSLDERVIELETWRKLSCQEWSHRCDTCPYRTRIEALEAEQKYHAPVIVAETVKPVAEAVVKPVALAAAGGGSVAGVIVGAVLAIGKILGWW